MSKIFSGDYSRDMWDEINEAKSKDDLRAALYFVCCRLQEFESRFDNHVHKFKFPEIKASYILALIISFVLGFSGGAEFVLHKLIP
jgi:hypothetical protein